MNEQLDFTCQFCSKWFCDDQECQKKLQERSYPSRQPERLSEANRRYIARHGYKTPAREAAYARYVAKNDRSDYYRKRYQKRKQKI